MGSALNQNVDNGTNKVGGSKSVTFQFKRVTSAERESYRVGSYGYIM